MYPEIGPQDDQQIGALDLYHAVLDIRVVVVQAGQIEPAGIDLVGSVGGHGKHTADGCINRGVPLQKIDGDAGCRIIVFAESNIIHIHEKSSLLHVTASIDGKNGPVNIEIYKQRLFYTIPETEYVIFFPKRSFQRDHSGSILPEQWETDKEEMDEGEQETEKKVYG